MNPWVDYKCWLKGTPEDDAATVHHLSPSRAAEAFASMLDDDEAFPEEERDVCVREPDGTMHVYEVDCEVERHYLACEVK